MPNFWTIYGGLLKSSNSSIGTPLQIFELPHHHCCQKVSGSDKYYRLVSRSLLALVAESTILICDNMGASVKYHSYRSENGKLHLVSIASCNFTIPTTVLMVFIIFTHAITVNKPRNCKLKIEWISGLWEV